MPPARWTGRIDEDIATRKRHTPQQVVRNMRSVPITRDTLVQLVLMTLLPVAPLLLTMISPEELLGQLVKIVF